MSHGLAKLSKLKTMWDTYCRKLCRNCAESHPHLCSLKPSVAVEASERLPECITLLSELGERLLNCYAAALAVLGLPNAPKLADGYVNARQAVLQTLLDEAFDLSEEGALIFYLNPSEDNFKPVRVWIETCCEPLTSARAVRYEPIRLCAGSGAEP